MRQQLEALREAARLWKTDSPIETVAAIVLVLWFVGWPFYQMWRSE